MTCQITREQLFEVSTEDFDRLGPHLASCQTCSGLAARIDGDERAMREYLVAFEDVGLDQAWQIAVHAVPIGAPPAEPFSVSPDSAPGVATRPRRSSRHDPSRDLGWAMGGTLMALCGVFILASASMLSDPIMRAVVIAAGQVPAIAGALITLLILLTGRRGRRPARTMVSMAIGGSFAGVLSTIAVSTNVAAFSLRRDAELIRFDDPVLASVVVPDQPSAAPTASFPAVEVEAGTAGDGIQNPQTPEPASSGGTSEPSKPPIAKPEEREAVIDEPVAPPPPPPPPPPIPMEVMGVMLYNNLAVKKCFVPLFKSGRAPNRVDLDITLAPSGMASDARISQADLKGGVFEACIRNAVMATTFPPFDGEPTHIGFPFLLNN